MTSAKEIVETYKAALGRGDFAAARELLHDDLAFHGPIDSFSRADDYLAASKRLANIIQRIDVKKVFADGNDVCVGGNNVDSIDGQLGTDTVLGGRGDGTDSHVAGTYPAGEDNSRIGEVINELFNLTSARPTIFSELLNGMGPALGQRGESEVHTEQRQGGEQAQGERSDRQLGLAPLPSGLKPACLKGVNA